MAAAQTPEVLAEYPVLDQLVMAGQPRSEDWSCLAQRGFQTVVNIRRDPARAHEQAKQAAAAGLRYVHLPLPAYELEPEHIKTFDAIISDLNNGKTLFHCRSASRTGLVWMLKRTVIDGWTEAEAEAELRAAGYDEDNIDTFHFCAEDYFERTMSTEIFLQEPQLAS
jgi:uncharacterized protein (TIGR01244 family)